MYANAPFAKCNKMSLPCCKKLSTLPHPGSKHCIQYAADDSGNVLNAVDKGIRKEIKMLGEEARTTSRSNGMYSSFRSYSSFPESLTFHTR